MEKDMYGASFPASTAVQLMSPLFWDEELRCWVTGV
jgi:hypothetical protein